MPYQIVTHTPAEVSGLTDDTTYIAQNSSASDSLSRPERLQRPVVYYSELADADPVDRAEHGEIEPGDSAVFQPVVGMTIWVWLGSVSQSATLAISESAS